MLRGLALALYDMMARSESSTPEARECEAVLWTDGAARGNPGPAGIGAVLKNASGEVLYTGSEYLGHTTNNVAEYKAVLLGLSGALAQGIRHVEVRADSELLIKQLKGEYRVKSVGLRPLYEEARRLIARFASVKLTHIRRELNGEADRLANQGIDQVGGG
ncbi:MAG TPA: ribonuclease HI family protein [Polyangiaceae bacterium]|nr:ribonuclease HI family protein [Polyangiaceae bacterium]